MKENRPCALISSSQPQPKRAGPLITIRTSTFVELLGHAREWDAKFPALAGASRAYLIESFAFADSFCSFAAEERAPAAPRRIHHGRVKRLLLYAALFLALLSPPAVKAQSIWDFTLYASADCYLDHDHWWWCAVANGDSRSTLDFFKILQLPVPPDHIYVGQDVPWVSEVGVEPDGTTSISLEALPGNELYAGQAQGFWIWIWRGDEGVGEGGYCVAGDALARCAALRIPALAS